MKPGYTNEVDFNVCRQFPLDCRSADARIEYFMSIFPHIFNLQLSTSLFTIQMVCALCAFVADNRRRTKRIELRFVVVDYCKFIIKIHKLKRYVQRMWVDGLCIWTVIATRRLCVKMHVSHFRLLSASLHCSFHSLPIISHHFPSFVIILALITKVFCLKRIFRLMFLLRITVLYDCLKCSTLRCTYFNSCSY